MSLYLPELTIAEAGRRFVNGLWSLVPFRTYTPCPRSPLMRRIRSCQDQTIQFQLKSITLNHGTLQVPGLCARL